MKYLIQFSHSYLPFRLPELDSLLELNHLKPDECYSKWVAASPCLRRREDYVEECPFLPIQLPGDDAALAVPMTGGCDE